MRKSLIFIVLSTCLLVSCIMVPSNNIHKLTKGVGDHPLIVTRDYLERGHREKPNYGAYSYILLAESPLNDMRFQKILEIILQIPQDTSIDDVDSNITNDERNITYIPILKRPDEAANGDPALLLDWVVNNYDIDRSARYLFLLRLEGKGPFIVTHTSRLSFVDKPGDVAVLDLSSTPYESIEPWVKYFINASQYPEKWAKRGAERMLLRINDVLTQCGESTNLVINAMSTGGKIAKGFSMMKNK